MPKPLKYPTKVLIGFNDEMLEAIDNWRRKQAVFRTGPRRSAVSPWPRYELGTLARRQANQRIGRPDKHALDVDTIALRSLTRQAGQHSPPVAPTKKYRDRPIVSCTVTVAGPIAATLVDPMRQQDYYNQ
jgi:hypothetical protein